MKLYIKAPVRLNSEKVKPVVLAVVRRHQSGSLSVSQSVEISLE